MKRERINVLLIEDNPADARLIEEMLKDAQAKVSLTAVGSLTVGVERLESNKVDVVLLDLGLPESTGLDTYRKLRDKFPDIAVIVLTGLDDYEVATTAVREGAQDYIVKGQVDPNPLARSIRYAYDRKQAEAALRTSEEKYRILFAANLAGVYRSTPDGMILECNEAMAKMLGYRLPEELLGVKTPATYADPTERQIMLTQLEKRKSLQNYEIKLRAKDGDEVWCLMNVVLLEESGEKILQGNLVDITERKQTEEKLRMLARVVEQVGEGVAVATLDGELTFANAAWAKMHGLEVEEITGKHLSIFHNKEQLPEVERFNAAVLRDGVSEGEVGHVTRDGVPFITHMTTTLLRDEADNPIGFIGVVRDITEKKRTEAALEQYRQELALRNVLSEIFLTKEDEEMYASVMETIRHTLDSEFGLFGYIDENGNAVASSLTRSIWDECQMPGKSLVFPPEAWGGIWGQALKEKRTFWANEGLKVPDGHVPLENAVATPILNGSKLVGLLTVGNKEGGYTEDEVRLLETLAGHIAPVLDARLERERLERLRQKAEEALRQSESRFRTLFELGADSVYVTTLDEKGMPGNYIAVNRTAYERLGYTEEEMLQLGPQDINATEFADVIDDVNERLQGGKHAVFETEERTKDGRVFPVEMSLSLFEYEGKTTVIAVARDIAERKRAEAELRKLWSAVEQSPSIVVITDLEGTIEYVNPMFTEITGYTAEEAVGQNPRILKSGQHPPELYDKMWATLTSGQVWRGEFYNKKKNGELYWESAAIAPVKNEQGETTHYVAVKVDVTDRKRAEEHLRYRLEIEEAVARASREFTRADGADLNVVLETLGEAVGVDRVYVFRVREGTIADNTDDWCSPGTFSPIERLQGFDMAQLPWALARFHDGKQIRINDTQNPPEGAEVDARWFLSAGLLAVAAVPVRSALGELEGLLGFETVGHPREWRDEDIQALQVVADMLNSYWARERAEMGIAQVATELRELIDTANAPILGVDTNGLVNEWNQRAEALTGFSRDEILGKNMVDELVEISHRPAVSRVLYDAVVGKPTSNFEYPMKTKSGKHVLLMLNATPRRDIKGEIVGVLGVGQDVTELVEYREGLERKVEERTQELETVLHDTSDARDRIDAILKSVADGLIVTDMYNRVVLMNRAAEELLGRRLSEAIGLTVDFAIEDATLRDRLRSTLDKRQEGYEFDFTLPGAKGVDTRILSARTSLVRDRSGEINGIVTIIHDVTHDREMDRMKTEFVSTAAHELRTPLTSIQGFSEILLTREDLPGDKQKKYLGYINHEAVALANIINDLLDISRIESGKGFSLSKKHCDVSALFARLAAVYCDRHPTHTFATEFPPEPLQMFVDPDKMHQVLDNILSNAVKYSPDGGKIAVSAREMNGDTEITVTDEGLGMTTEQVAKIFDKFYRADASNTAIEGTGLGMTIVKHIVEAHGGTVKVDSEFGKGTVVTITLPRG